MHKTVLIRFSVGLLVKNLLSLLLLNVSTMIVSNIYFSVAVAETKYKSLCGICDVPSVCSQSDKYWGRQGALQCLSDCQGEVAWSMLKDAKLHFSVSYLDTIFINFVLVAHRYHFRSTSKSKVTSLIREQYQNLL